MYYAWGRLKPNGVDIHFLFDVQKERKKSQCIANYDCDL